MKKKLLSLLLVAAMTVTMAVGCGSSSDSGDKNDGNSSDTSDKANAEMADNQELVFQENSDAATLDTIQTSTMADQHAAAPIYEGLLRRELDEDGNLILVPGAAESYEVNEDETVYTFHLQPEGKFSDGTPVTAEDVVYSFQRAFDPKLASPQSWQLEDMIVNAKACFEGEADLEELGVKAIDEQTVEITLNEANPNFLTVSTFPFARIVSKAFVEECGNKFGSGVEYIMGSGPFKLVSWNTGSSLTFEPNEYYWNKENVHLTKLTLQVVQEASTLAQSLMNDEIDIAQLNDADWNSLVDETGYYKVEEVPQMSTYFFVFNCADPILSNAKIRLALSLGFDRERYNEEVYYGKYIPAYSFEPAIATVGDSLYSDVAGDSAEYLKKLAKEYSDPKALLIEGMKEAGLGDDPSTITIKYTTLGTTEAVKKSAEWMKQELETNLGINLEIELTEWNVTYDLIDAGNYQMAFGGWSIDSGTEPWRFLRLFEMNDGYYGKDKVAWTGEKAEEYSKYAVEMQQIYDPDRLLELYELAEPILLEESPVAPVYFSKQRTLVGTDVEGYQVHPFLLPDFVGVYKTAE